MSNQYVSFRLITKIISFAGVYSERECNHFLIQIKYKSDQDKFKSK